MVGFFCAVAGSRLRKLWRNECADGEACKYSQKHNGGGGKFVESAEGSRLKIQEAYWGGEGLIFAGLEEFYRVSRGVIQQNL
jgi:hypothetical protein